ncbi:MAG: hypothetical protein ACXAEN_14425 [Candidatus Thorarchaeota archaeon]|jgi:hypothetical protein
MSEESAQEQITSPQPDITGTPSPIAKGQPTWRVKLILIAWVATIGFDFLWHGGLLAEIYTRPNPVLLNPEQAFARIPFGYGSLLLMVVLVYWLVSLAGVNDWQRGLRIGFMFGGIMGITSILGQYSILKLELELLILWGIGQVLEFGAMGAILGAGASIASLRSLTKRVAAFVVIAVLLTIVLQSGFH